MQKIAHYFFVIPYSRLIKQDIFLKTLTFLEKADFEKPGKFLKKI